MRILITSGGTTEKIDELHSISNNSTGRLGKAIAEAFAEIEETEEVFYICGLTALVPDTPKAKVTRIASVSELETAVRALLEKERIDVAIHCMAVSDYRVKSVTTSGLIGEGLCKCIAEMNSSTKKMDSALDIVSEAICSADSLSKESKISSDADDLILVMEKTPKIISLFKELSPKTLLVGVKCLNNVEVETLLEAGYGVLTKNECDFVLANDIKDISASSHTGYLIDRNRQVLKLTTKREIAERLAQLASQRLSER